jgi:transposase-like protein
MNLDELLSNYLKNQELNEEDLTKSNLLEVVFLGIRKMVYELLIKTDFNEFIGYEKYKSNNNRIKNYRNGSRKRKLNTVDGCINDLVIPRAREKFYPALSYLKKNGIKYTLIYVKIWMQLMSIYQHFLNFQNL